MNSDEALPSPTATKYITGDKFEDAMLENAERRARFAYYCDLRQAGQKAGIHIYDFRRGFEYGVQWALDNLKTS